MEANAIGSVTILVTALTQLAKWSGLPDGKGPFAVLGLSALGVAVWIVAQPAGFDRLLLFEYFSAWALIATSSAGVFGFTRAAASGVTAIKAPPAPAGAGASPTVDTERRVAN